MLAEKKLFQVVIMHRGFNTYTVAAHDLIPAIEVAVAWFLEHRRPDMAWKIESAKRLSFRGVIYDTEEEV